MVIVNPTTLVQATMDLRFLIMDAPSAESIHHYLAVMRAHGVTHLARICELTYPEEEVINAGIKCYSLAYPDGDSPPQHVIDRWLDIVEEARQQGGTIAVHCVAGLGRAPVLAAVAMIEKAGYDTLDAVDYIRSLRKGAINRKQLEYLSNYKRRSKNKKAKCGCFGF
ncbi:protein tyrosine phosphatase [Gregarina niphandrodes]|uniref:protein-tyrosine-phosphatase n=1 Tax=Gregarina niphandrodes TaxID=110365 RepID=A0A023B2B0_GRENI|nr:protein tyrosine phosphatase [Gregarina niphandrodes]EZG51710.1 protein tyrosine phosphatase [Gregarina niphandrodes]|eukprot:XP_011131923.1 protein tyrosine phosphatase [Gregarina niphandrodes]